MKKAIWLILFFGCAMFALADIGINASYKISNSTHGFNETLSSNYFWGSGLANYGDADGDGINDILISGSDRPKIRLLYMNSDGTVDGLKNIIVNSSWAVDMVGDIDDDGYSDIVVGDRLMNVPAGAGKGGVSVLFMDGSEEVTEELIINKNTITILSGILSPSFGSGICALGDIDDDGVEDFGVGAYKYDTTGLESDDAGAFFTIFMNSNQTVKNYTLIDNSSIGNLTHSPSNSQFGYSCEGLGDLDSDGVEDVAVGAIGVDSGLGGVYILFLNSDGSLKDWELIDNGVIGNLSANDNLGYDIANVGDLDADGVIDIAVSNYGDDDVGNNTGAIFILNLDTDGTLKNYSKITLSVDDSDHFGYGLASIGDYDSQLGDDLAVGAIGDDDQFSNSGAFYITTLQGIVSYECSDSVDNDGDGFTDYPTDPSCSSATDDTESPFDTVQCNDGIDNDIDGFTDYPDDPSCTSLSDTTEFPADISQQPEDDCLVQNFCVMKDTFPYSDNITLHNWYGTPSLFRTESVAGSNRLFLDNSGSDSFIISKNITNPNNYNQINIEFQIYPYVGSQTGGANSSFYIKFKDADDNIAIWLRVDATQSGSAVLLSSFSFDGSDWNRIASNGATVSNPNIDFEMFVDQQLKTFTITGDDFSVSDEYDWKDIFATKIHSITIEQLDYNSDFYDTYIDNILIQSGEILSGTVCTEWDSPYFLREEFNGYLSLCEWYTTNNIYFDGQVSLSQSISLYSANKETDLATEVNTRYVTMKFDANIINITTGDTLTYRLYDDGEYNFLTIYFRDSGDYLWYDNGGTGTIATQINLSTWYEYMVVVDLQSDNYDIYVNNSKVVDDGSFANSFYNLENINWFKFTSNNAEFKMDNLEIFGSDALGEPLLPDEELVVVVQNDTIMCGRFYRNQPTCAQDSDCETGKCLPSNKCSQFDNTYCDEKGFVRGNKCIMGAITGCVLSSTKDLIFDNFILFLVLLLMIMGFVLLSIKAFR